MEFSLHSDLADFIAEVIFSYPFSDLLMLFGISVFAAVVFVSVFNSIQP